MKITRVNPVRKGMKDLYIIELVSTLKNQEIIKMFMVSTGINDIKIRIKKQQENGKYKGYKIRKIVSYKKEKLKLEKRKK